MEQRFANQIQIDSEEDNYPFPQYMEVKSGDMFEVTTELPYLEFED